MAHLQPHIIARYGMELDFGDRHAARGVSEDLLDASRRYIATLIDECCNELVQPDEYITIPRLEIDLGRLDLHDLVGDFLEKFRGQLRQQMQVAISAQVRPSREARALEVVAQYGETGQYPWWAGAPVPALLTQGMETLLHARDRRVHQQLRELLRQGNALRRLVLALPEQQITALWEAMVAMQAPIPAQATIETTSRFILENAAAMDRRQWQAFAFKAVLQTCMAGQVGTSAAACRLWLQLEGNVELPQPLMARFDKWDEFVALVCWLQENVAPPAPLLAAYLVELFSATAHIDSAEVEAPAKNAFKAWLKATWKLDTSHLERLMIVLQQSCRDRQAQPQSPKGDIADTITSWLRNILHQPQGRPAALLAALATQYIDLQPFVEPTPDGLVAWLQAQFSLPADAPSLIAQALLPEVRARWSPRAATGKTPDLDKLAPLLRELLQQPRAKPADLLSQLAAQYAATLGETPPTRDGLQTWLRSKFKLPADMRDALAQLLLPEVLARHLAHAPTTASSSSGALTPLLQALLHQSHGTSADLIGQLAAQYVGTLEAAAPELENLMVWLRTHFTVATDMRAPLAEAIFPEALAQWEARASTDASTAAPAWLPWLREILEMPTATPIALLTALRAHFEEAHPAAILELPIVEAWLQTLGLHAHADRASLAQALVQQGGQVRRPTPAKEAFPELQPILPWLRRKLDQPAADAASLVELLVEQYYAAHPTAEYSTVVFENWLSTSFRMPKEKRLLLAKAMLVAARKPSMPVAQPQQAQVAPQQYRNPERSEVPFFVENAGLIIFWPFLQRFFQLHGLVEDKSFVSVLAQEQAVRLLQLIVMPDEEWNEAALALPKLLCGLSPDALVDPQVPLTDAQLAGADDLIGAALAHWTLAGEMSEDGFRRAWLQRSGTLRIRDDHWLLRVETMGHDMILDGLPWDIAYIQLPWMRHVLYVDWAEKAKFNA